MCATVPKTPPTITAANSDVSRKLAARCAGCADPAGRAKRWLRCDEAVAWRNMVSSGLRRGVRLTQEGLLTRTIAGKKVLIIASKQVNNDDLSDKGRTSWTPDSSQPGYGNFCYGNREVTLIDLP
jgi:hypothetical protein